MNRLTTTVLGLLLFAASAFSQSIPYSVYLEAVDINGLGGLQSYAYAQHDGKWLIIGGRLDGLHQRQPFAAFSVTGNNNQLIVVDPVNKVYWSTPVSSLPVDIREQLSSTNMEFHQEGDYLYLLGGYGYNNATATRKTFESIIAVTVPALINAVISGSPVSSYFRQIQDAQFAVTGGHLKKINDTYYLVGGNKFNGNYNPMGRPTFTQIYTNAIRRFTLSDDGTTLTIQHLSTLTDSVNLHRRDYNAVPQIFPDGSEGITAFSGVFTPVTNLPFLNCVNIDSAGYKVNNDFQQLYNHYHCAVLPMYSESSGEMHTLFFGGIAQYYHDSTDKLVQDNNVPFVKTIAMVTRDKNGIMKEYRLPVEMPELIGASAEFIPASGVERYKNHVLKADYFTADTMLAGYIYGGINSSARNIFFTNTGVESVASSRIYKVHLIRNPTVGISELKTPAVALLNMQVYPNPSDGQLTIQFNLTHSVEATLTVLSPDGKLIERRTLRQLNAGPNTYQLNLSKGELSGNYLLTLETPFEKATQKILIKP